MVTCPQCGFIETLNSVSNCNHCGNPLEVSSGAETTLTDLPANSVLLADGRFIVDEFVGEIGPVQYYDVHEAEDRTKLYTLAVCSKNVDDPLIDVGFEFEF